jgi:hypothetical protein
MAWTLILSDERWTSALPEIRLNFYYDKYRSGSSMFYKTRTEVSAVTGASSFGYTINQDLSFEYIKRETVQIKNTTPNQWASPIVYDSPWYEVPYKTSGTTNVSFRAYSNSGRDATYSYSLSIDPAGSTLGYINNFNIDSSSGVGSAFSVPCTKYYSGYYDVLTIKIGANTVATRNNYVTGNVTFTNAELTTATTGIYARMSGVNSTTFTFELKTYTDSSKSTQIGSTSTTTATGYLTGVAPILSSSAVTHLDSNSTTVALTGSNTKFIQGYSTLQITVSAKATAQSGATLGNNAYVFEVPGETTQYANQSDSLNFVKNFTTIGYSTYNLKVIDSRGQQLTIPKTLTNWTAYSSPVLSSVSVTRLNGSAADIYIAFSGTYTNWTGLSTTNSIQTARFRYREVGGAYGSYTAITLTTNASGSFSKTSYNAVDLDISKSYQFEIEVIDRLSSKIQTATIPAGAGTLVLDTANKLLGVGKVPTNTYPDGSIDAAGDIHSAGDMSVAGDMNVAGTIYQNEVAVLTVSSTLLNYTENTFGFSNTETITTTRANMTFDTQTDSSNTKVYLSSNKIVIHASVKLIFITYYYVAGATVSIYPIYNYNLVNFTTGYVTSAFATGIVHGSGNTQNLEMSAEAFSGSTTITNASTYFKIGVMY